MTAHIITSRYLSESIVVPLQGLHGSLQLLLTVNEVLDNQLTQLLQLDYPGRQRTWQVRELLLQGAVRHSQQDLL